MNPDKKAIVLAKEMLRQRLTIAMGGEVSSSDEAMIDELFLLMKTASKHAIADVLSKHGSIVTLLMAMPYAGLKDDE